MVLSRVDRDELLLTLYALDEATPFAMFLERLRRRTRARETFVITRSDTSGCKAYVSRDASGRQLSPLSPELLRPLRSGRLYDLEGLSEGESGKSIRAASSRGDIWLGIRGGAPDSFDAGDGALLSALVSHVAIAFTNLARFHDGQVALAAARAALDRAGVGWAVLDEHGEADGHSGLDASARQRAALVTAIHAGAELAAAGQTIALPFATAGQGAAVALYRKPVQPIDRAAAFAAAYGLTWAEARMAVALAEGASIVEAATRLNITEQTARHYSKRLYTATGTRGQAELVRLVWTSVAALA
ncbi:helix-turn-helix transcriptional regulator [Sphingomonas sp. Mn802worker]|uniref:helix-turn-helix transcriptional regulator n=1 Tax=Sphingomonas sp. Mn802worker TaxID=629773 RepID=UPI000360E673|nr:hypothetical protein [Sphingomonas sp. Mn802worker]